MTVNMIIKNVSQERGITNTLVHINIINWYKSKYTEQEKTEMLCGPSALLVLRLEIIFSTSVGDK